MGKHVVLGATVKCSMGSAPSHLFPDVADWTELSINNLPEVSVTATRIPQNMAPFGICSVWGVSSQLPCDIRVKGLGLDLRWEFGSPSQTAQGEKVVTDASVLGCRNGGEISVVDCGQVPYFWEQLLLSDNLTEEHFVFLANLFLFDLNDSQRERFLQLLTVPSVFDNTHPLWGDPISQLNMFFDIDRERALAIYSAMSILVSRNIQLDVNSRLLQDQLFFMKFIDLGPYLYSAPAADGPYLTLRTEDGRLVLEFQEWQGGLGMPQRHSLVVSGDGPDGRYSSSRLSQHLRDCGPGMSSVFLLAGIGLLPGVGPVKSLGLSVAGHQQGERREERNNAINDLITEAADAQAFVGAVERHDGVGGYTLELYVVSRFGMSPEESDALWSATSRARAALR